MRSSSSASCSTRSKVRCDRSCVRAASAWYEYSVLAGASTPSTMCFSPAASPAAVRAAVSKSGSPAALVVACFPCSISASAVVTATHEAMQRGSECVTLAMAIVSASTRARSSKCGTAMMLVRMTAPLAARPRPLPSHTAIEARCGSPPLKCRWFSTDMTVYPMPMPPVSPSSGNPRCIQCTRRRPKSAGTASPSCSRKERSASTIWSLSSVQSPGAHRDRCMSRFTSLYS
mmetsp:Transcript_83875/g.233614  ORF Transcript_83875/g.233614 Transcript_83875/m.233614 type:complete len:231 (-) Transcript_83875:279-971(-)